FPANGLEAAQALALDLSRSLTPQRVLESANVKTFDHGNGTFDVKPAGSDTWFRLAPQRGESHELAPGYDSRVGDPSPGSVTYLIKQIDAPEMPTAAPGEYLRFNSAQFADQREIRPVRVRGPPAGKLAGAREVEIADGDLKVRAFVDSENVNSVFFEGKSLPKELQSPERLLGFVTAIDVPALQKALRGARANDAVRVKVRDLSQT